MKKNFLKPFAVTVGTMLVASAANASVAAVDTKTASIVSNSAEKLAGLGVALQHASGTIEFARHGSHSSHSSHASHSSHSSHASSSF